MEYCSHCGTRSSPSWVYCRDCGAGLDVAAAAIRPAFCTSCAYELAVSWRYCPRCGTETPVADRERSMRLTAENAGGRDAPAVSGRRAPLVPEIVEPPEVELISRGWGLIETEWVEVSEPDVVVTLPTDPRHDRLLERLPALPQASGDRSLAARGLLPGGTAIQLALLTTGLAALAAVSGLMILNRLLVSFADGRAVAGDVTRMERFVASWLLVAVLPLLAVAAGLLLGWHRRHPTGRRAEAGRVAGDARRAALAGLGGGSVLVVIGRLLPRTTVGQAVAADTWTVIGLGLLIFGCLAGVRIVAATAPPPPPHEPAR